MATSTQYVTWSESGHVRLEIIQVDNGSTHVNVSCNFQVGPDFGGAGGHEGDWQSFDSQPYDGSLTAGGTTITWNGTNGNYPTSPPYGWKSIATKWIGTIPRSAGTFSILWNTKWLDTEYGILRDCNVVASNISIMAYTPPNAADTLADYSAATIGTSVTFRVINSTSYAHTDTLSYQIGSASGNISASFSVPANSVKTVTWTPASSLGGQIPSSFTGTVTLTLTTSGQGSNTYTCMLTVPSYTYTASNMTVAKYGNYTSIGGSNYIAGKHTARWTMPSFPSAQYGATISGTFSAVSGGVSLYTKTVSGGGTADYTHGAAGTVTGTLLIKDSRGVSVTKTLATTWVANPTVKVTSSSIKRDGQTTTVRYAATGTYDSTVTGLAATLTIESGGVTVDSANGAGGTAVISSNTTTQPITTSAVYTVSMTDTLGNVATKKITVPMAFFYLQVGGGNNGRGISIGRAASTSGTDTLEIGLPTTIDSTTKIEHSESYMSVDADNNSLNPTRDVIVPQLTSTILGTLAGDMSATLQAYLKWIAKNVPYQRCRCRGLLTSAGMYVVDVLKYSDTVDANGVPQYSMGICYSYGTNTTYRFGTNNYNFSLASLDQTAL